MEPEQQPHRLGYLSPSLGSQGQIAGWNEATMTLAHSPQQNRCLCLEVTAPSAPLQCEGHATKCPRRGLLQERAVHRCCGSPPENSSWCFGIMKHSRELKSYLGEHLPRINQRFMWSRFLCSPRSQDEASPIRMSPCQISIAPHCQNLSLESIPKLELRNTGGRNLNCGLPSARRTRAATHASVQCQALIITCMGYEFGFFSLSIELSAHS